MVNKSNGSVRDRESLSIVISKDEMNLAEFPFTLLSRRAKAGQKTIEVSQQIRDHSGRIIKQGWIVTGSDKYGLPLSIDEDIYVALMQLYKENNFIDRCAHFSRYQLLHIMGKETSKRGYDRIERALNRLISVTIVSKNAFWDNKAKRYVSEAFHLFDSYRLYDERPSEKGQDQQSLPLSNIVMSEFLFDSIKAGYIKNLDTRFYFSLETPLSKRLYRYLDKKRYHKHSFEIGILKLAALLPLQDRFPSQIKRRLDRSHNELIEKGFLEIFSYKGTSDSDEEKVIYTFPQSSLVKQIHIPVTVAEKQLKVGEEEEGNQSLKQKLIERGITESGATKLMEDYPAQQIERQIEVFDWLTERNSPLLKKNPAGFLRKSIEEDYQPPEEYRSHVERETRKLEEERIAAQKRAEEEEIERELARMKAYKENLSHEERAELREKAEAEIKNSGQFKEEFVTEYLIQAKENELIGRRLGIKLPG